ncbi:MAG: glycoside hydrolase family 43 protein [Bacteroidetes bacterium]|nr:glycoside hydrolase family 43 protein [Bacteroidota bacterium]
MINLFVSVMMAAACCGAGVVPGGSGAADTTFMNPILRGGPDPWVVQKGDTYYYTHTLGNRLGIWATPAMSRLGSASPVVVWTPPASGPYSKEIWAPEIHNIQGKWYMYFAADDGSNDNHRIYVVENDSADPLSGKWNFRGKVADSVEDRWAIDASVFGYGGKLYMVWSGWKGATNGEQDIFIAEMSDPVTLNGRRVLISAPTYTWERMGMQGGLPAVNEGPEALIGPKGQLFLTFSASGCWTDNYCLGLLTLRRGGDPLRPEDWTKSAQPVFSGVAENGVYAPGHNGFFVSKDGKENWVLYHANAVAGAGCGNARSPRMQRFGWKGDGTPDFGTPVKVGVEMRGPGGE